MPAKLDAEAICHHCGKRASCKLDVDRLMSRRFSSPGGAMSGLPDWYYKNCGYETDNLACSEKCAAALTKATSYSGEWNRCGA